ncbi:DUF4381 domain-containing protein [uncultured Thiodictyon sp.]|uniref:DUF4381 domain-containing protein n=1 Tax=uncultured Thiodictyon sp. TaxID=1846217 RepID=UPI0025F00F51|nr:DUF4381 domain-containing protein [uncultured Thiodictyon sp.]
MADPALTPVANAPPTMPDPLAGLRDWHLPEPVSWWPPAPGWWLVAGVALVALLLAVRLWRRRRRRGAAVRVALDELRVLRGQLGAGLDPLGFAAAISVLLRRLALTRFPRERVAGLSGTAWLAFLDATGGGEGFSQGPGRALAQSPYRNPAAATPQACADPAALGDLAERWIRANRGVAA